MAIASESVIEFGQALLDANMLEPQSAPCAASRKQR